MKNKVIMLLMVIAAMFTFASCGVADANDTSSEYQVTLQIYETSLVPGYAPRIVYKAFVESSNRVIETNILVDFSEYLNKRNGTLPTTFAEPFTAIVRRARPPDNTFTVISTFYDLK